MSATGFGANEIVDLYFDADTVARVAANGAGAVGATNASVPFGALPGAHWFTASGERTGTGASARFVVRTDWRQAGSDSGHAGFNPFESQLSQFSVRDLDEAWAATTGGLCTTTPETPGPATAGGVLYIGSHCQPRLCAKDAATGANRWQVNLGGHVNGTPAVAGGLVIVAVDSGWVRAYSVTSHALVWRIRTANASMPAITVAGDRVYVLEPGKLSAFSTTCATGGATCQRIWTAAVPFATLPQSAPAANARHVVVAGSGKVLGVAADCNTGGGACSPEWNANLPGPAGVSADPVLAGGFAYVADDTSGVSAFRIGCSCFLTWLGLTDAGVAGPMAVAHGVVYAPTTAGTLYAFDSTACGGGLNCPAAWTGKTPLGLYGVAAAGDLVYATGFDSIAYAFPQFCAVGGGGCSPAWRGGTPGTLEAAPVVVDGRLYATTVNGVVHMFDRSVASGGRSAAATGPPDLDVLRPDRGLAVRGGG